MKNNFYELIENELLITPTMKNYKEFYGRRREINRLFDEVVKSLPPIYKEYVMTLNCTCDCEEHGVLRYAFYIGYWYALAINDEIKLWNENEMLGKILCTEHELGFTNTYKERERDKDDSFSISFTNSSIKMTVLWQDILVVEYRAS